MKLQTSQFCPEQQRLSVRWTMLVGMVPTGGTPEVSKGLLLHAQL